MALDQPFSPNNPPMSPAPRFGAWTQQARAAVRFQNRGSNHDYGRGSCSDRDGDSASCDDTGSNRDCDSDIYLDNGSYRDGESDGGGDR